MIVACRYWKKKQTKIKFLRQWKYHKRPTKKGSTNVRPLRSLMISMHSILGWASFCMNYGSSVPWHCANKSVGLLGCDGSPGCVGVCHLDKYQQIFFGVGSGEFAGPSSTVTPWSLNQLLVPLWTRCQGLMKNKSRHLHAPCQHREAWSALQFPCRWLHWLWTSENTVDQQQ